MAVDRKLCRHRSIISLKRKTLGIKKNCAVNHRRKWREQFEIIEEIFGARMVCDNDRNVISASKINHRLTNHKLELNVCDIWNEVILAAIFANFSIRQKGKFVAVIKIDARNGDSSGDFSRRRERFGLIRIKREIHRT